MKLIFPCYYVGVTQGFKTTHKAIDLGWDKKYGGPNHKIIAPADGIVTYVKNNVQGKTKNVTYGNYIKINHGNGVYTLMAHLKYGSATVKVGDKVKQGQTIGIMGNTGYSFGVHCHYEVYINKKRVNPFNYTYYTDKHVVGTNTLKKYKPKKEESEVNSDMDETENKVTIEVDNTVFEYICPKTGIYKIKLNENEKLIIKD